jgi:hypothetical protein
MLNGGANPKLKLYMKEVLAQYLHETLSLYYLRCALYLFIKISFLIIYQVVKNFLFAIMFWY